MYSTFFKTLLIGCTLGFIGCTTTPPQPKSFDQLGQYQTIPLNASSYRISFKTDGKLSYGHAEEIALVKAAQVTLKQGFDAFKVIDDPSNRINSQNNRQTIVYPSRIYAPYDFYGPYRRPYWHDPFYDMPYVVNVEPIEVAYTVQMFKQSLAPADAFEARPILETLGQKYGVTHDGTVIPPSLNLEQMQK